MRAVVQRVSRAKVTVGRLTTGEIGLGLLVLLGVAQQDTEQDCIYLAEKIAGLRIFEDEGGKMNRSVQDAGGSVLADRCAPLARTTIENPRAAPATNSQIAIGPA